MMRKMLLVGAAIVMPLGAATFTAIAGPTIAEATSTPIICHPGTPFSLVHYAPPGLSQAGSFSPSPTSTTTTDSQNLNCTSGASGVAHIPAQSLVINSTKCTGTNAPDQGCTAGQYHYDSIGAFANNASTLWTSIPTIQFTINGVPYTFTSNASNAAAGCQSVGEVGFTIHGTITSGPAARVNHVAKYVACLGADTGPGTSGSTTADLGNPNFTGNIQTSTIDNNSKIRIA